MRSIRPQRAFWLTATLAAALASTGCPELNRQPAKVPGPEFSHREPKSVEDEELEDGAIMLAQQGELPDRARRAR